MDTDILKKYISKTPDNPGIYRFHNKQKKDIYIGKASSIKKRLTSYGKTTDSRIQKMITVAEHLTYTKTDSDIEALILESQLIKQRRPQFNIMLRDDKQYFFVSFTNETFPRLFLTHQPQLGEPLVRQLADGSPGSGAKDSVSTGHIGPFTDGTALKTTLKFLRNIFPYCTCKQKHHNFCLNYHIGKCLGFCCLKDQQNPKLKIKTQNSNIYQQNIKAIKNILSGKKNSLIKELKKEMETAGKKHDFPRAIELRNKLERLERVFKNARIIKSSAIIKKYTPFLSGILHNT
ncbi:MAG: GIY-YIG nuclease family protein, partial [bacterium]|nr:GIY-YIG nuclease family protein [bacterium]